jgi:hypothetical protein
VEMTLNSLNRVMAQAREETMQQMKLALGIDGESGLPIRLDPRLREELVALMASVILAVHPREGEQNDEDDSPSVES